MNRMAQLPRRRRESLRRPDLSDMQHIVLDDVSWDLYEQLLQDIGNRAIRITFDQGRLEMMSPLPEHDGPSRIIARFIQTLSMELNIEVASYGSTTFRRRDKEKGLEPDECFYFKNEKKMRSRKRLNMKKDPPPELVVEIDITHRSIRREPIYAALGVSEIWRWDGTRLTCLLLRTGE
jgi:Uma2 family endonuclease